MSKANGSEALVAEQLSKDRAVIELCRRSLVNHFVVRDMDAALAYMADDVEWLGPFSCQTASDKKTMEDILRPEYSIRLALADERWRAETIQVLARLRARQRSSANASRMLYSGRRMSSMVFLSEAV